MKITRIVTSAAFLFSLLFFLQVGNLFSWIPLAGILAMVAVFGLMARITGKKMQIQINVQDHVQKGDPISIVLELENLSKLPIYRIKGELVCENLLTGEVSRQWFFMNAGPKGTATKMLQLVENHCGAIEITVSKVQIYDPLMLFGSKRAVTSESGTYVTPEIQPITIEEHALHAYNMESYQYSPLTKGNDPSETFGIREYREGDSPKTIHWKLTGKTEDLIVRELGLPVENSILLLMDKRMAKGEVLDAGLRASAAELFLSLSHSLLEKGIDHSVAWMEYRKGTFIMQHIENQNALWTAASALMASPYREDAVSTPVHYLEHGGGQTFASYFYVTAGQEPDQIRLEDHGAVKVYRAEDYK